MKNGMRPLYLGLLLVGACGPLTHPDPVVIPDNAPNLRALSTDEINVSGANNDFAFNLYRDIRKQGTVSNIFISPLSVGIALGMTLNGAGDSTQKTILNTIQFGNLTPDPVNHAYQDLTTLLTTMDRTVEINFANSIWYNSQYSIKSLFATSMKDFYDAKVEGLDFSTSNSVDSINTWVADKTQNKITKVIEALSPDQVMFLINAIYFKGDWAKQFDASQTQDRTFTNEDNSAQQTKMMFVSGAEVVETFNEGFTLVDLPYGNAQFSMTILLPRAGFKIEQIANNLTSDSLNSWLTNTHGVTANIWLPKFKMNWKKDLKGNLQNLGMATSGFPNLFEQPLSLEITQVIHQSSIEVNETGSVATAVTTVVVGVTATGPIQTIEINHPFIYFIREKHTGVILFMGQLFTPG